MEKSDVMVRPSRPHSEEVIQLSVMDQLMPRRHMSYLLCFRHTSTCSHSTTIQQLQTGLATVLTEMPHFAGELRQRSSPKKELELFLDPYSHVLFRVVDATNQLNYEDVVKSMHEKPLVADDQLAVPAIDLQTDNGGVRAFAVQVTIVSGGLLLATSIHHALADARATEVLFESWSKHTAKAATGRSDAIEILPHEATARWRLSYGPQDVQVDNFLELCGPKGTYKAAKIADRVVAATWTISPQGIQKLKDFVKSDVQLSSSDLVCALIARHVYKARIQHEHASVPWPSSILLYVTSDMRSRLEPPLAKNYQGNASVAVPVAVNLDTLLDESTPNALGTVATQIKHAIDTFDTNSLRSRLSFYKTQPFYGSVVPNFEYYPGPNMLLTDSSSMSFYSFSWGPVLQTTDYFKSVGLTHSVGQCALNPKRRDGSIELQMRHDQQVVEAMKSDKDFTCFFELVGYC
ncbi:hypothetical protein H2198_001576 [Neophaeococcomyces mojaviensis]|uniref:Uncharacterized protein n=1 Tax=Neophaeococcomyces mojaviensis TaxID=3383035 RepID=A0ACC3AH16_9EURO|nr:hypothetical protein H2198_001576 [Knufia sp. JES_112]